MKCWTFFVQLVSFLCRCRCVVSVSWRPTRGRFFMGSLIEKLALYFGTSMMEHNIFYIGKTVTTTGTTTTTARSHCVRCCTLLTTSRVVSRLLTRSGVSRRGLDILHGSGRLWQSGIAMVGHIVLADESSPHGSLPLLLTFALFWKLQFCHGPLTCGLYAECSVSAASFSRADESVTWTCVINSNCSLAFLRQTKLVTVMLCFICGSWHLNAIRKERYTFWIFFPSS